MILFYDTVTAIGRAVYFEHSIISFTLPRGNALRTAEGRAFDDFHEDGYEEGMAAEAAAASARRRSECRGVDAARLSTCPLLPYRRLRFLSRDVGFHALLSLLCLSSDASSIRRARRSEARASLGARDCFRLARDWR